VVEPEYSIIERNLRETMVFFGVASGFGDVTERDGVLLIDSGVNYGVFNIAMLTSAVKNPEALVARIATAATHFGQRRTRWSMWVCEELLADAARKRAAQCFLGERLRRLTEAPGMIADAIRPPARPLPQLEWRKVNDAAARADFAHLTSLTFDIPLPTCRSVYGNEQAWSHHYHGYVGYVSDRAVTTVAAVVAANSIGIYSVGTLPEFRRRGFAEALMRVVIDEHRMETGIERTVLQATRAGYDMYLKMGYRPVSHFTVYMT
jgi:GNAT superfamily N-acetyltransferase